MQTRVGQVCRSSVGEAPAQRCTVGDVGWICDGAPLAASDTAISALNGTERPQPAKNFICTSSCRGAQAHCSKPDSPLTPWSRAFSPLRFPSVALRVPLRPPASDGGHGQNSAVSSCLPISLGDVCAATEVEHLSQRPKWPRCTAMLTRKMSAWPPQAEPASSQIWCIACNRKPVGRTGECNAAFRKLRAPSRLADTYERPREG